MLGQIQSHKRGGKKEPRFLEISKRRAWNKVCDLLVRPSAVQVSDTRSQSFV